MNIEEFVSESLKQIIDGIVSAQAHAQKKGARINPPGIIYSGGKPQANSEFNFGESIEFDVAVIATSTGIRVLGGPAGGSSSPDKDTLSVTSHIKFTVPLWLPVQEG